MGYHSALDSHSILSKLATPPHAIIPDMSQVIDDATSTMNDNDNVHEDTQPDNDKEPDNDVEIEPAVDLDNPQPKNKRYD